MSLLDMGLNDAALEPKNIPVGEQKLVVTKAEIVASKKNTQQIVVSLTLESGGNYWPIRKYFPLEGDDEQMITYRRMLKEFCSAFSVPVKKNGSVDTEDMVGCSAWCFTKNDPYEGQDKTVIEKYVRIAGK